MNTFSSLWRQKVLLALIYLDDILLLASSPENVRKALDTAPLDLEEAGLVINHTKSVLEASQNIDHLGFTINLKDGLLQVPLPKLKSIKREFGKLVTKDLLTPRKMAAILGQFRSFLMAMPFLRAFTDQMLAFIR